MVIHTAMARWLLPANYLICILLRRKLAFRTIGYGKKE